MKRDIESYQGLFLTVIVCFGGLGAVSAIGSDMGHQVWLLMLPVGLAGVALFFGYGALLGNCGGRDLATLHLDAFGPRYGRIAVGFYLACFLFAAGYYLLSALNMWRLMDMRYTPMAAYIVMTMVLCVLMARLGLPVIGHLAVFFVALYFVMALTDTLLLYPKLQWQRLLPFTAVNWPDLFKGAVYISALLFALLPLALFYLPRMRRREQGPRYLGWGMLAVFADILVANLRNAALFGDALQFADYPTYQALRLVEWGSGILRLELAGLLATLAMVFVFGALVLYAMAELTAAISGWKSEKLLTPLAVITGLVMLYMQSRINFVDNSALLIILSICGVVMLMLLLAAVLKLQKSNCQNS